MTGFDLIIIPLLFLEYFVQKFFCGIYYTSVKLDHWNFNRNLDQRNKELAAQTPLSHHD